MGYVVPMSPAAAEVFSARVLGWLAADPGRIGAFLGASGLSPADVPALAGDAGFLLAVLDHLMADEGLLLACCADLDVPPQTPGAARAALPGGAEVHWT